MPTPHSSETVFPTQLDLFREVFDGNNPENRVYSAYIMKVQRALTAIQTHAQYTPSGVVTDGPLLYPITVEHVFTARTPGVGQKNVGMTFHLDPTIVREEFQNDPFNSRYGLLTSAIAYRNVRKNGRVTKVWHRVHCAPRIETGQNLQLRLAVLKTNNEWRAGDHILATVTLIRG